MNVSECTLQDAISCEEHASITEVARIIADKHTRHVIVTKNEQPVGIISVVDIVTRVVAQKKDPSTMTAKEIMTSPLEAVDVATPLEKAYLHMIQKNLFSVPVTKGGKLVGMLPFSQSHLKSKC